MNKKLAIILLVLFWTGSAFGGNIEVDLQLSNYSKQGGVSGNVSSVGSDTLNNLMTLWSEKLKQFYPNINIQVEGKGSSTAPPALISATAQLGPMSRNETKRNRCFRVQVWLQAHSSLGRGRYPRSFRQQG